MVFFYLQPGQMQSWVELELRSLRSNPKRENDQREKCELRICHAFQNELLRDDWSHLVTMVLPRRNPALASTSAEKRFRTRPVGLVSSAKKLPECRTLNHGKGPTETQQHQISSNNNTTTHPTIQGTVSNCHFFKMLETVPNLQPLSSEQSEPSDPPLERLVQCTIQSIGLGRSRMVWRCHGANLSIKYGSNPAYHTLDFTSK